MRTLFLLILSLTLYTSVLHAQGYRGKRMEIDYNPAYSMANPIYGFSSLFLSHRLNFGYALSNHWMINLNGQFASSRPLNIIGTGIISELNIKDISGGFSFLYFRKFHQGYAPVGRYMGVGVDFGTQNTWRVESDTVSYGFGQYDITDRYFYDDKEPGSMICVYAIFGRNYLIRERYLFGYGIQYGYVLGNDGIEDAGVNLSYRHVIKPHFKIGILF